MYVFFIIPSHNKASGAGGLGFPQERDGPVFTGKGWSGFSQERAGSYYVLCKKTDLVYINVKVKFIV